MDAACEGQFDIAQAAKRANCSAAEIIRMILARELDWVGRLTSKTNYPAILVDLEEIKQKTRLPDLNGLTAREIEKKLNTATRVVKALTTHGILKTERRFNPVNRCPVDIVPTAEFERFRVTYVGLFELAREYGVHHLKMKQELEERGIAPALDPKLFHATLYVRSEIQKRSETQDD